MFARDGKLLVRGDRVLVTAKALTGDGHVHVGTVIAFAEAGGEWRAVVVLDKPSTSGAAIVDLSPPQLVWLPDELEHTPAVEAAEAPEPPF
jgi:hypothetical protein